MKSFIISGANELARSDNVTELRKHLPGARMLEAIYPSLTRVPFLPAIIEASKIKTGKSLLPAEIGCLLSHRKAWQQIIQMDITDNEHCLILESDSTINNLSLLKDFFEIQLSNKSIYGFQTVGFFIDIGIPEDFERAQHVLPNLTL